MARSRHFDNAAIDKGEFPDHISRDGTAYYGDGTVLRPATTDNPTLQSEKLEPPADLLSKIRIQGQCWIWTKAKRRGYGSTSLRGKSITAHRYSYLRFIGPVPDGLYVLHRRECTSRACVNPAHLYAGTQKENMADAIATGAIATGDRNGTRLHPERVARGERITLAKLNPDIVRDARRRHAAGMSVAALGRELGVALRTAQQMIKRETWKHVE